MSFYRIHVELTNICGLRCSFCPPKTTPVRTMSLECFEDILKKLQGYTKILAFHVMGDPLTLSNLASYLDLAHDHGFSVELTTSGYFVGNHKHTTLLHPAVRQINISLNSFNKNDHTLSFDAYMTPILELCQTKLAHYPKPFINLRLWNLDAQQSENFYNKEVQALLAVHFKDTKYVQGSMRLASKIILDYDSYFEWPSLESTHFSHGYCYGLKSHIAILADGTVVPCCLDASGVMNLGNIFTQSLKEILNSSRSCAIKEGFIHKQAVESLCQKCLYKERFAR